MGRKVVVLPFLGEFGWLIMTHCRLVNRLEADEKIVCCPPHFRPLFPSATGFFHDYTNPIPDNRRCGHTAYQDRGADQRFYAELTPELERQYPGCEVITSGTDCHWHLSDAPGCKFRPKVRPHFSPIDVAISPRFRAFEEIRNWDHWPAVAKALLDAGLRVGIVGSRAGSYECLADAYAWCHPDGDIAGSIDLLAKCRLFSGIDSGMAHLAALMDVETVLQGNHSPWNEYGPMQRSNRSQVRVVSKESWDDPAPFLAAVLGQLRGYSSQFGEDRWLDGQGLLPARGVFVEVGCGHPRINSNTYTLEARGWSGCLIEADPRVIPQLQAQRKATVIHAAAVGPNHGPTVTLHQHPDPSLSTTRPGAAGQMVDVPAATLTNLLGDCGPIDVLSVDTEGTELDVLSGLDWQRFRPRVVIVECCTLGLPDNSAAVLEYFAGLPYRMAHRTAANLIFVLAPASP